MDIGKNDEKFGSPILLTMVLLIIIPSSAGYIDCRISCRRCHENTEHPAVLEVYCAMCEECKQRRRERMLGKTKKKINPKANPLAKMRVGVEVSTDNEELILRPQESFQFPQEKDAQLQYQGQPQQQYQGQPQQQYQGQPQQLYETQQQFEQQPVYQAQLSPQPPLPPQAPQEPPEIQQALPTYNPQEALRGMAYPPGCPTPPLCSDSEDEPEMVPMHMKVTVPTTTTTTTTTTTQAPCPPVLQCKKKKKYTTYPTYAPPPPSPPQPPLPIYPQPPYMNPCMVPPMCGYPMYPSGAILGPNVWPGSSYPQAHLLMNQPFLDPQAGAMTDPPSTMDENYDYVFIGLPK